MKSLKRIWAFTKRNALEILREPICVILLFVFPIVMLVGFYAMFHELTPQFEIIDLAPSMIGFGCSFIALFVGILITTDKSTTFLTRLYTTPMKSFEFILGYTLALLPIGVIQAVIILITGVILSPSFLSVRLLLTVLLSIPVSLFFVELGILFGSICNEKSIGGLSSIIITGQSILSGMWFPPEGLNEGFVKLMNALPFKNVSTILRNASYGQGGILKPLLVLLAYAVATTVGAVLLYKNKMKEK